MTHVDNIPHVLKNGITHKSSELANPNYVPIGDSSLISTRESRYISVTNGQTVSYGFINTIRIGDFIPFYFGYRMPMLFVIQKGYNGVKKQQPGNIVYCVINIQKIIEANLPFLFYGRTRNRFF